MATKVEKRRVRKERAMQELGLEDNKTKKTSPETLEEQKLELKKWAWFFLTCLLLWFIYTFGPQG